MTQPTSRPILIGSWNAAPATTRAFELHASGTELLPAIVQGIKIVEDDPEEMSVGFGGLPNEDGEVELDAAVMDGPRHKAGGVAGLHRIRHVSGVAYEVLQRTDHALLVGEGAFKFARQLGFPEEDLSTPKCREAWLAWKANLSHKDAWLSPDEAKSGFGQALWAGHEKNPEPGRPPTVPFTYGTIHVSGVDQNSNLFACTSTSGLSYKIPGRVGDSPIVGAGLFVDNDTGSAGATGRGESTLHTCGAYEVVRGMEHGLDPVDACLAALHRIARLTREKRLLNDKGRPAFNVTLYALRKDGAVGSASMHPGYQYVVQRAGVTSIETCASLFPDT